MLRGSVTTVIIVLAINGWMVYARMTRGVVLAMRERPFVEAAEIIGARPRRVIFTHILPNLVSPLATLGMLEFARIMLAEAALSFLGLGIQFPQTSWGIDAAQAARTSTATRGRHLPRPGAHTDRARGEHRRSVAARGVRPAGAREAPRSHRARWRRGQAAVRQAAVNHVSTPVPDAPLLEVDHLRVEFFTRRGHVQAVRDVSFHVGRGETLGLVGESGSGKSVTAQALLGLIELPGKITGGDVRWKGQSLVGEGSAAVLDRVRGNEIAMVFQDPMTSLNPVFTVGMQIAEVLRRHRGMSRGDAKRRVVELLDLVGIANAERRAKQYPHEMSGGMRQRVLIAMALACEPQLLVADEPTTALDVTIQAQILDLIAELQTGWAWPSS